MQVIERKGKCSICCVHEQRTAPTNNRKHHTHGVLQYLTTTTLEWRPTEQMLGKLLVDGPRPSVPHWFSKRGLQACIGRAARASHLHSGRGRRLYKNPPVTPIPTRYRSLAEPFTLSFSSLFVVYV